MIKYYELDKKWTKKIKKELKEEGIYSYPAVYERCNGEGCKYCNNGEKEVEIWKRRNDAKRNNREGKEFCGRDIMDKININIKDDIDEENAL